MRACHTGEPSVLGSASKRSVGDPFTFEEHAYEFNRVMDYARQLMEQ